MERPLSEVLHITKVKGVRHGLNELRHLPLGQTKKIGIPFVQGCVARAKMYRVSEAKLNRVDEIEVAVQSRDHPSDIGDDCQIASGRAFWVAGGVGTMEMEDEQVAQYVHLLKLLGCRDRDAEWHGEQLRRFLNAPKANNEKKRMG